MAFILNLYWSNWPRRVLTQFLTQLTSCYCSLVKSSWRRAVLHHKILPAVHAVFLSGRGSIRFQTILRWPSQGQFRVMIWRVGRFEIQHEPQFWCCIGLWWCKKKASMVSARIQPVSRIWNSARTSVQEFGHAGKISLSLTLRRSVQRRFDLNPDSIWLPHFASVSTV